MTKAEALRIGREVAGHEGWPWTEPVFAVRERAWLLFGRRRWRLMTNAGVRGGNVSILLDDQTGDVIRKGFAPR